ncbi:SDR family oxidoreductase [Streptomyces sp. NPDC051561]|uniref:SDR family oxidoreductase n=1 Tax=Streptomyces sp. NPDC051561 TaxID=3365658 RepID=UPI00378BCC9D
MPVTRPSAWCATSPTRTRPPPWHELRQIGPQGSGAIVTCSSLGGLVGLPERAAAEYAPKGIRVRAVCPGVIETSMVADMLEGLARPGRGHGRDHPASADDLYVPPLARGADGTTCGPPTWLCPVVAAKQPTPVPGWRVGVIVRRFRVTGRSAVSIVLLWVTTRG